MIIGFDAKRAFFNTSGLGNYSRNTIKLLSKYYNENTYFLYSPSLKNKINFIDSPNVIFKKPDSLIGNSFKSYWRSFLLTQQLEKDNINIYHGLSNELPSKINKSKIKSVVTIHDLIFLRYPNLYKKIDREIYKKKFQYSCFAADKIIAVSNQTKADIVNFLNINESKIEVVYQGCNLIFKKKVDNFEKENILNKYKLPAQYILYVGTIEQRKNLLNLIKAVHIGCINIPIVAIGKPTAYINKIKEYISINKLEKRVFLYHNVSIEELPVFYQMAEMFVYPSTFEGFGIPIIEAMYSGIPVITSRGGCFSEAGGKNSIYIDPENIEEILSAIKNVASDPILKQKMIKTGLEHANNFNEDVIANNLMSVYNNLQ
ncbi:MAG: hypothetical protein A2275_01650 [Bacteroidetes bacterium RIFOXYA12_FULL_35_11]|nr:MAG: hypothetical protein A2X01_04860 [Bacteroidetes bacterium GWF2_35_48]OFY72920.1 MAG: hypothetical protein A2275_01650 [Bacteroidetes bacterium RIFOXYA12_FULL_35_11]HBX51961.1 glycosyl transferase family 1 [Bacteroidales bacterium]